MIRHRPRRVVVILTLLVSAACAGPATSPPPATIAEPPTSRAPSLTAAPSSTAAPSNSTPSVAPSASLIVPAPSPSTRPAPTLTWREVGVSGPRAREDHTWTVAADGITAFLFGGRTADGPSDEIWEFDLVGQAWTQRTPVNAGPAARFGHTATWVPDVGLVVWSGQGESGFFDDIWRYEPAANEWQKLPSSGAVPPARYGSCASLGPDGGLWISHGFTEDSGRFSDTRSYNFATGEWTDRTPSGDVPVERCLHDCFWSSAGKLILYGGQTTGVAALGDLWAYEFASGSWTEATEPSAAPRQLYAMANDERYGFVFGGRSTDGTYLNDTWELDAMALDLSPFGDDAQTIPARSGAAIILDPATATIWLFGGTSRNGLLADTWAMSPSTE